MVARRLPFWPLLRVLHRARRIGLWTQMKPLLRDRLIPVKIAGRKEEHSSAAALFQMATGYWVSQAIYVTAKLGIADLLKDGPQSYVTLAVRTGADGPSLFRLMRALASVDIFSHVGKDCFALSRLAESLRTDTPASLRAMVITIGEIHYQAWGNLLYSVQTGSPAFSHVFGTNLFDYLQQNASAADAFNKGMTNMSSMLAYALLIAYDFAGISSIVDSRADPGGLSRTACPPPQDRRRHLRIPVAARPCDCSRAGWEWGICGSGGQWQTGRDASNRYRIAAIARSGSRQSGEAGGGQLHRAIGRARPRLYLSRVYPRDH